MPMDMNDTTAAYMKMLIEEKLVTGGLSVQVTAMPGMPGEPPAAYEIRMGDGHVWSATTVAARSPLLHGWNERLTRIVHDLVQKYAIERFTK